MTSMGCSQLGELSMGSIYKISYDNPAIILQ